MGCARVIFWTLCVLVPTAWVGAQTTVSQPFSGYYHPGRFIPVRVSVAPGVSDFHISAPGCVSTTIYNARGEIVVPFLPIADSINAIQITGAAPQGLKSLGEHQRLVATAGASADLAKQLFPSDQIIPVELDLPRPLLDPPLAWTGLDAVVLDSSSRARVSDQQIGVLLAAGVAIVAEGDQAPRWPWRPLGNAWVLRHDVSGPKEPIRAEAYTPTYSWDRGVPPARRGQIIIVATLFGIIAVGLSLWRGRRSTAAFTVLSVGVALFVFFVYLRHPPELTMWKGINVEGNRITQEDLWVWHACLRESMLAQPADGLTFPVFASAPQIDQCEVALVCDRQGRPVSYEFRLGVNQSMAFLTRSASASYDLPNATEPLVPPPDGVWRNFVEDLYARPGDRPVVEGSVIFINRRARE